MAEKLIYLDNKHISVDQMTMSVDRVLQCYICNMPGPPSPLFENYLLEARFWHVATIGLGCKECTITLEDVYLQLGLPVDGYAITGSASSTDWGAPDNDSTELERIRYALAYILQMIGGNVRGDATEQSQNKRLPITTAIMGTVSLSIFTSSSRPPIYISTHKEWNHSASYVGIHTSFEDIRLVLDQRSEAQFQWTPYEDPAIRAVIPDEFLQNPNAWHVKVALVNYATVEMHQSDRVLRQFGFRQLIPVAPEVFDDEHKVDLRQLHTD
ncbi:hypothetical protein CXB51_022468 [Gossypium anomalum]|uniref:Aminotransferase-like plant mobile domain-containing protein n=1 Tax=Gossypium anomalum TaxID=47600 RepID=A0A8J5YNF0_9ROSI|nr:hypothetical protein CXB51_022468 [Gossypium anomalum]